ncbi:HpcH/HpaI aldolase [Natrinema pellirubrum DSM 15624]|uniref:2,4-dihydroxyhept-2-ene-1,7-dioic acid aldolase n=1 Tax=Natrinema pellirubrum (strain DSM 15624 / CIP 106293 / JCM 10476 / NCIMB 786 / 157) TaxID=797303 RepID=L0JLQ9_NATP1|nr:aldolase/citrate lyase family protein [Natrinema pellirubrum]AGB32214.1 2,4-dihydroxyhept-2-ene-1,7-dioic acid aldolase [Natrinema pellirubrum DSM 15624]ELY74993.1 HpcH/HpaI aldolase [Natrinema pellirubrum DSM 15624]
MSQHPRTNALRETLESGDVALGVLENTYSPTVVELYAALGVDFVWIDLEHGGPSPVDGGRLEELLRAADGTDTELLVRLPDTDPALVRKALDAGVRNVFLPRVGSREELEAAVRAGRFEYDGEPGRRGMANPRASRWGLTDDYVTSEDESVVVGVTIETQSALDELDDILAVPELGFVFIGPLDLSVSLGHPGEFDHPEVEEAVERIRSAAIEADVPVGGLGFGMDDVNEKAENGYQLLNVGTTTGALQSAVTGWLDGYDGA